MRKLANLLGFIGLFAFAPTMQCVACEIEEPHVHEMNIAATNQDLYFENDQLMVVVGERSFPVNALQRNGNQWQVQVVSAGYCQMGHNLCKGCGTCHKPGCIYYIRPCKLWE